MILPISDNQDAAEGFTFEHTPDENSIWVQKFRRKAMISKMGGGLYFVVETLAKDQWENFLLVYHSQLKDGETYHWADWVRPSVYDKHGGWTDDLFNFFRGEAFEAFAKTERQIENEKVEVHTKNALGDIEGPEQMVDRMLASGPQGDQSIPAPGDFVPGLQDIPGSTDDAGIRDDPDEPGSHPSGDGAA